MSSLCPALIALSALAAPAPDELPGYRWRFEQDRPFYVEVTTQTRQTMKVQGNDVCQEQKQTFYYCYTPLRRQGGGWVIRQTVEGVKMEIDVGGNKIAYDSTQLAANNPLADFFKALVGWETLLTLGPDMKVSRVEGVEELRKKLAAANPQMGALLGQVLNEDTAREMSGDLFAVLPGRDVVRGDGWARHSRLDMGPIGRYAVTHEYTHGGNDGPLTRFQIANVVFRYEPPAADKAGGLPFLVKNANLKGKGATGRVLFDTVKGRVDRSEVTLEIQGGMTLTVGGQDTEVELQQVQKTTLRTSDASPIKK
jgi:hypothetical protein